MENWQQLKKEGPAADFSGDGIGDIAVFRPGSGLWAVRGVTRLYFGGSGDLPVPGNYSGRAPDQPAIFRFGGGLWGGQGGTLIYFGGSGDEAIPGDYDGDGKYEYALFREASGLWAVRGITREYFGSSADLPIAAGQSRDGLPPTGQTTEYRPGDDGDHQAGAPFRYELIGTMVTVDNKTGLMWARQGNKKGCNWGQATDWESAIDYCDDLDFAGYDDWRLPNVKELQSVVTYGNDNPAIDTYYFLGTKSDYYWSSTSRCNDIILAFYVDFDSGEVVWHYKTNKFYVRAVRSGE